MSDKIISNELESTNQLCETQECQETASYWCTDHDNRIICQSCMIYKHGAWNEVDKIVSAKELKQLALIVFDYIKSVNYYVNSQNLKSELIEFEEPYTNF